MSLILNGKIPSNLNWTVKMWHFGRDGLTGYSGKQFDMTWEDSLHVFHHVYSKEYEERRGKKKKKTMKIRDDLGISKQATRRSIYGQDRTRR